MRLLGIALGGVLLLAVAVLSVALVKTNRKLDALTRVMEDRPLPRGGFRVAEATEGDDESDATPPPPRPRMPPPEFVAAAEALGRAAQANGGLGKVPAPAGDDPLPLPPALSTPEAREQLRQFVAAQLQRQRDEERERAVQRREEQDKRWREQTAQKLGLSGGDAQKFNDLLAGAAAARREVFEKIQNGEMNRTEIGREMARLREGNDKQLQELLGPDRFKQYQEEQRNNGGGGFGFGGGRGRGGGGALVAPAGATP